MASYVTVKDARRERDQLIQQSLQALPKPVRLTTVKPKMSSEPIILWRSK